MFKKEENKKDKIKSRVDSIIEKLKIKLPSTNQNIENNVIIIKKYYNKVYFNKIVNNKQIELFIGLCKKIINNNILNLKQYFKDFKRFQLWPKINKIISKL